MGIEHKWGQMLCLVAQDKTPDFNPSSRRQGTSPNQKGQYAALNLAFALKIGKPAMVHDAVQICKDYIMAQQRCGHMNLKLPSECTSGPPNEMLIAAAHYPIWALAMGVMHKLALEHPDECEDLDQLTAWWWDVEHKICSLFARPDGVVVCPATRWIPIHNQEPSYTRSCIWRAWYNIPQVGNARRSKWWNLNDPQTAGAALAVRYCDEFDDSVLFKFCDEIHVARGRDRHYSWAPKGIRAMKPVTHVCTNYATGLIYYTKFNPEDLVGLDLAITVIPGVD